MLYADFEKRLDRFTLKVHIETKDGITALFGASGAGKSMSLKCIAGIEKPDKGVIQLNGRVLFDSENRINLSPQKRHIGYLFQDYALFPDMDVEQNIIAGLHHLPKSERKSKAKELIERFKLTGLERSRPSTLSGGEKQRVALARIFASQPEVILLDEPFASLDTLLKYELIPYIKDVISEFGGDTVLVSHDVSEVLSMSDRVIQLINGQTRDAISADEFSMIINKLHDKSVSNRGN